MPGEVAQHTVVVRPCLTIDEDAAAVILRALIHAGRETASAATSEPAP
jgi:hypothetical protein